MKLRKRLLTFIFAGILLLSLVVTTMASDEIPEDTHPFTDVAAYGWATESLNKMYEKGIINGTSAITFDPEGRFTREMIVTMFWRLERSESNGATPTQLAGIFTDGASVSDYAREAVLWAYTNNVVSGYPEGDFRPQNVVTRQEAAKFIVNYAQYAGITLPNISDRVLADTPDAWAYDAVYACVRAGIITGDENGYFRPNDETWRIHAAHLMAKLPEKPKPVSTDKNDPNPDKIGYASYGDLVLADGFSLSKTLLVTDGNSKNQFTATTFGNYGWHETRIVRNEYGTYVVFAQDEALDKEGTYSGQYTYATVKTKFYLVKVSDNGFKKVLEGYYPSSWSGSAQVNVLCGNDGLRWLNLQLT